MHYGVLLKMNTLLAIILSLFIVSCNSENKTTDQETQDMKIAISDYDPDIAEELFQDHFDYMDQYATLKSKQDYVNDPDNLEYGKTVMEFSELDRDLYFIHDTLAITNNAGLGAWIYYHRKQPGWIDDAARAYSTIGLNSVADALISARDSYDTHVSSSRDLDDWSDLVFSSAIWDVADQIHPKLYTHLRTNDFTFRKVE